MYRNWYMAIPLLFFSAVILIQESIPDNIGVIIFMSISFSSAIINSTRAHFINRHNGIKTLEGQTCCTLGIKTACK